MSMMNQYGGFSFADPGAGLATVSQPATGQMGQPVAMPMQMQMQVPAVQAMPAQLTCALSNLPVSLQCPLCQSMTTTSVDKEIGLRAKISICAFVMSGCCILIPLCWNNLKDSVHYCSNCQKEIGRCVGRGGTAGRMRRRRR